MGAYALYEQWLADPLIKPADKKELQAIASNEAEIEDRFYRDIEFGTAGLRGVLGIGTNRMNIYTVARTTQGYANYLLKQPNAAQQGVVIAYDSRHQSEEFAQMAARVLTANHIRVFLFDTIHSVPQLSFAIGYYESYGGIVITASHNPSNYNGYKVYGSNGAQISPDIAFKITDEIQKISSYTLANEMALAEALEKKLLSYIGQEVDDAYFAYLQQQIINPAVFTLAKQLKVVYTPLNGTGSVPIARLFDILEMENAYIVEEQRQPDGDFSNLEAPNPELLSSYTLAIKAAEERNANLIFATDPDADRLGVAIRSNDGTVTVLNGNQIAYIMGHYILSQRAQQHTLPENGLFIRSIVSGNMLDTIAKAYDVRVHEVLTGFRYIGEQVDLYSKNKEFSFLFGFEESNGYLSGTKVRDKDAIGGVLLMLEIAAHYAQEGLTLLDVLYQLYEKYGYYCNATENFVLQGKKGMEQIQSAMESLREDPPKSLEGTRVLAIRDYYMRRQTNLSTQVSTPISLPQSNVLYFELEHQSWLCVRPSGTEPKLKVYANVCAKEESTAQQTLSTIIQAMEVRLRPWLTI